MKPFVEASLPPEYSNPQAYMNSFGVSYEQAVRYMENIKDEKYYVNDQYQVHVSKPHSQPGWPDTIHLSIKRLDKEPLHDWRDLQEIKNMLVGPENEAVEIYPSESRLVDMANQYHLWVFADSSVRIPIGWTTRMVATPEQAAQCGAKQRAYG